MNASPPSPDQIMTYFFKSLSQYHFPVCWNLLSTQTQKSFMQWTLRELYRRNEAAAKQAKLGLQEIKFMFENNDPSLIQLFWRKFASRTGASDLCRYGYFQTITVEGGKATVQANVKYPNGQNRFMNMMMVNNRGGWKFGVVETGLWTE